jgi:hypothetical protein
MKVKILDFVFWSVMLVVVCGFIREFFPFYLMFWTEPFQRFAEVVAGNIWNWEPVIQRKQTPAEMPFVLATIFCWVVRLVVAYFVFRFGCFLVDKHKELKELWSKPSK